MSERALEERVEDHVPNRSGARNTVPAIISTLRPTPVLWDLDVLHVRWDRLCARDIAGTSRRRRPRRRRWPIDGLVLMGAAATLRHCSPSESGPGSDADQPLPRRPKWAGAHSSAGGDAVQSRVRRLACGRVLFRRAYVGCKPGYCTPRAAIFLVLRLAADWWPALALLGARGHWLPSVACGC